eukprot:s1039_g28.t2
MLSASLVHDSWVQGGVLYGEPDGHMHPDHRTHNAALLQTLASHVCHLVKGFRFVAGDFNETIDSLPAFSILQQAGFKDLQTLAYERFGQPVVNTCKQRSRKDFCFISPELQDLLIAVQVLDDIWPDHVVLQGRFQKLSSSVPSMRWFTPREFPWPVDFHVQPDFWCSSTSDVSTRYANLWQHVESQATPHVPFGVSHTAYGRGQALTPVPAPTSQVAPLRTPRKGEFAPHFHGVLRKHVQWVRQVRRLQAFVGFRQSSKPTCAPGQAALMWRAVCSAKSFRPTLPVWWCHSQHHAMGAPAECPLCPPDHATALLILESVIMATRHLEQQLIKESRQYARMRREQNPNTVFRDIREPGGSGLDVLTRSAVAHVESVDSDHSCVLLDRAQDWTDHPILCNGNPLPVIHAEADCIWVHSVDDVRPSLPVCQLQLCGTLPELSHEFLTTWSQRWHRHQHVPADQWRDIVDFACSHLPKGHFQWPSLNVEALQQAICSKKATTSGGLDGVSLADLKATPPTVLQNFCDMFQTAELTGAWPRQVVAGRVSSIAKVDHPQSALDFRPITVLGLLYRCWSSYHAQIALRMLDDYLPAGLVGSRPNKYAGQIWSSLLWDIEQAYADCSDLGGVIADIQKAFNYIPRLAVMELCAHVGLPASMLVGWTGALVTMERRFQIRDHITDPLGSTTGVPEGCALSCVAMMVLDWSLHLWFRVMMPLARPLTFVDDWQVVTTDSSRIQQIMDCLCQFAHMIDMLIDERKTFSWSITREGRASIRAQGFAVVARGHNLGAHVQFTRQHTNSVQVDRLQTLQTLWPRLRLSPSPYRQKLRAILMAAWPRGLHAIAATTISSQWFQTLRSGAMKGLLADGAGVNSHLHLGMIERLSDVPDNSITSTLATRIQILGWNVTPEGCIRDELGTFSLFDVSSQELHDRAALAWQHVISSEVQHRKGFEACHRVHAAHTREWLVLLSSSDAALFRKVLNGAHFTQDVISFSQPEYYLLVLRLHRQQVSQILAVLTSCGWSLQPCTCHAWQCLLAQMPDPDPVAYAPAPCDVVHMFTDGSCLNQHDRDCRIASWVVVHADPAASTLEGSHVVDSGPLPGLLQNAYRAEVYGVLRAFLACQHLPSRVCLWIDCAAVVKRLHKILQVAAHKQVSSCSSDLDAWCARNNATADRAAVRANFARDSAFWTLYLRHLAECNHVRMISRHVQHVQLAVSRAQVRLADDVIPEPREPYRFPEPSSGIVLPPLAQLPAGAVRWYGIEVVRQLVSWFWQGVSPSEPVRWISHFQLYLDFQLATGERGPVHFSNWTNGSDVPLLGLRDIPFKKRTRWFTKVMKEILRHLQIPLETGFGRPFSEVVAMHTGVWALAWPLQRLTSIDQWMSARLPAAATRGGKALDSLPLACRDSRFEEVFITLSD